MGVAKDDELCGMLAKQVYGILVQSELYQREV